MSAMLSVAEGVHCIDLDFQGRPGVIAAYLVEDAGERVLIESGPGSTLETLLGTLAAAGIDPASIDKVLVTHIHLDHAGAAGTWLRRFPEARLYVHHIGVPHLVDPTKLIASATRIYGDMMGPLWGTIEPVPEDRVVSLDDGDQIAVGRQTLDVLYTPGHAVHHVVFHLPARDLVFAGDVAAIRLQGFQYVRPPTPPPDIDLEAWTQSLERLRALRPASLALTHFGPFGDTSRHLTDAHDRLYAWAEILERALDSGQQQPELTDTLRLHGDADLLRETNDAGAVQRYELAAPYGMSVDGYLRYFRKHRGR